MVVYVYNVQLNWVNRESHDLRWRCGCLFTFIGASRSHLCDSAAFLLLLHRVVHGLGRPAGRFGSSQVNSYRIIYTYGIHAHFECL